MDSAFYSRNSLWAVRRGGARFSVTARMDAKVQSACQAIGDDKWVDIKYPPAIWDEDQQVWISDAQIAETTYTAFGSTRQAITARLIVRRVKRLDRNQVPGQDELFTAYRYVLGAGDGAAGELVKQRLLQQMLLAVGDQRPGEGNLDWVEDSSAETTVASQYREMRP